MIENFNKQKGGDGDFGYAGRANPIAVQGKGSLARALALRRTPNVSETKERRWKRRSRGFIRVIGFGLRQSLETKGPIAMVPTLQVATADTAVLVGCRQCGIRQCGTTTALRFLCRELAARGGG
jgi:hypothetical protein